MRRLAVVLLVAAVSVSLAVGALPAVGSVAVRVTATAWGPAVLSVLRDIAIGVSGGAAIYYGVELIQWVASYIDGWRGAAVASIDVTPTIDPHHPVTPEPAYFAPPADVLAALPEWSPPWVEGIVTYQGELVYALHAYWGVETFSTYEAAAAAYSSYTSAEISSAVARTIVWRTAPADDQWLLYDGPLVSDLAPTDLWVPTVWGDVAVVPVVTDWTAVQVGSADIPQWLPVPAVVDLLVVTAASSDVSISTDWCWAWGDIRVVVAHAYRHTLAGITYPTHVHPDAIMATYSLAAQPIDYGGVFSLSGRIPREGGAARLYELVRRSSASAAVRTDALLATQSYTGYWVGLCTGSLPWVPPGADAMPWDVTADPWGWAVALDGDDILWVRSPADALADALVASPVPASRWDALVALASSRFPFSLAAALAVDIICCGDDLPFAWHLPWVVPLHVQAWLAPTLAIARTAIAVMLVFVVTRTLALRMMPRMRL